MNIDERFEKLEKQNEILAGQIKNLKKMLGGVAALALATLIGGTVLGVHASEGNFDTITAKTLKLKDSSGTKRVAHYGSSGGLVLYNSSGTIKRASLQGQYANLYLFNSRGTTRVKTNGDTGRLYLNDYSGKTKIQLNGTDGKITSGAHSHSGNANSARTRVNKYTHSVTISQ